MYRTLYFILPELCEPVSQNVASQVAACNILFTQLNLNFMNASQIHLALNHAPLFLSITGALILLYGLFRKNATTKMLSLYFMIAAALFTIPVYLTGEGTEEIVEKLPGISEVLIEEHEEMAKVGLIIIIITGVTAIGALLVRKKESLFKSSLVLCTVLSLASFGVMAQTAHLGGQIRHTEIRSGATTLNEEGNQPVDKTYDQKEKDDD